MPAYKLQASAENLVGATNDCGTAGATVAFYIDGQYLDEVDHAWDNTQAWFHPLTDTMVPTAVAVSGVAASAPPNSMVLALVVLILLGLSWYCGIRPKPNH